jgi:5'-nucleotidase
LPAVAISLAGSDPKHFETAAHVAVTLMQKIQAHPLPEDTLLNVNVPDLAIDQLKGYQSTRLGQRHKAEAVIRSRDPRGHVIYWVGPPGSEQDAGPGTDFDAIRNGYVSITPLQLDLTRYDRLESLNAWLTLEASA